MNRKKTQSSTKPKVLIIEYMSHFKVLENAYHLLHKCSELTFYYSIHGGPEEIVEFPSRKYCKNYARPLPPFLSFWPTLWKGRKYDYINISTGPEGFHWTAYIDIFLIFLLLLFYRDKTILTMRSARAFLPKEGEFDLKIFLRHKVAALAKRVTFETDACKRNYIKESGHLQTLCSVSYDRYTDFLDPKYLKEIEIDKKMPIRIGLLGVIQHARKDYHMVLEAIKKLTDDECRSLQFVNVSYCPKALENPIIKKMSERCHVDITEGYLDTDEFDERGISCHMLLSPVIKELEYGPYKGSGSFGDMVYLRRRIFLPSYSDPDGDFSPIAHCYSNADELAQFFKDIRNIANKPISSDYIDSFKSDVVLKSLLLDLKLS